MEKREYVCPKCGCRSFESDIIQTAGGNFAKVFDIQNKRFTAISCCQCGYTEFYKEQSSAGWNIIDFLMR